MKTKTPEQKFIETIRASIATLEREMLSRRIKRALAIKRDSDANGEEVIYFRRSSKQNKPCSGA